MVESGYHKIIVNKMENINYTSNKKKENNIENNKKKDKGDQGVFDKLFQKELDKLA